MRQLSHAGLTMRDVAIVPAPTPATNSSTPPCRLITLGTSAGSADGVPEGAALWAELSGFVQAAAGAAGGMPSTIIVRIAAPVVSLQAWPDAALLDISQGPRVVLWGAPGQSIILDVAGRQGVLINRLSGSSMLLLEDLVLVNLPTSPTPTECRGFTQASLNFVRLPL